MDTNERFGARLRELRKKAGLTQQQLGDRADVNYKFIGGIERGDENPSLAIVFKLAAGLEVDPRDLFELDHFQNIKQLRRSAKRLIDEAEPEDLERFVRLARALVR